MFQQSNQSPIRLLVAGLALWQVGAWLRRYLLKLRGTSTAKPAELATWEGEGGALRGTGSQTGPNRSGIEGSDRGL